MKYRHGDHVVEAADAAGIVDQMRAGSFEASSSVQEYAAQVAARAKVVTGKDVRTDPLEDFVADLVSVGLLEEVL